MIPSSAAPNSGAGLTTMWLPGSESPPGLEHQPRKTTTWLTGSQQNIFPNSSPGLDCKTRPLIKSGSAPTDVQHKEAFLQREKEIPSCALIASHHRKKTLWEKYTKCLT